MPTFVKSIVGAGGGGGGDGKQVDPCVLSFGPPCVCVSV